MDLLEVEVCHVGPSELVWCGVVWCGEASKTK